MVRGLLPAASLEGRPWWSPDGGPPPGLPLRPRPPEMACNLEACMSRNIGVANLDTRTERTYSSAAHRKCRASLARGNALFLHAFWWKELGTDFRRAVLGNDHKQHTWVWAVAQPQPCSCAATKTCPGLLLNRWFWYTA